MAGKREEKLAGDIAVFVRQYARKRYPGMDPNDRRYDREIEQKVRRMNPQELDALMHGAPDGDADG